MYQPQAQDVTKEADVVAEKLEEQKPARALP
jgi:hypothetical protein